MEAYVERAQKIVARINELAAISENQNGITRTFGTKAFIQGRDKVQLWMRDAGLETRIDSIGNVRGKRKKYFKPITLYLIWVAIHLLAYQLITDLMDYENLRTSGFLLQEGETQAFIVKNSKLFGLLQLPILSFFVWLIVSRPKLNFIETLAALIYVFAAIQILVFFQIIITGLLFKTNFLTNGFLIQVQVVSSIWTFYCFVLFFRTKRIKLLIPRILLALVIALLVNGEVTELIAEMILKMKH